ncbi:MAG: hypothetical protein B0A82_08330 [Alkalinema sp. CACIAM 70d]|nr:MAG: hypothetical protein B0A82_08330 [Alkalinema sp. CACIAM 70d]
MQRREFLKSIGCTLAGLGMTQLELLQRTTQYGQILAQEASRKLALLVGIRDYPGRDARSLKTQGLWYRLPGALTDLELQRELLIHRFGFHPADILMLRDQEATRDRILTAFQEHLLKGVKSDRDIAVFHYSGHGSTIVDPHRLFKDQLSGTIVPYDADLPLGYPQKGGAVRDITAGTIFLLREAIARRTQNATFVLDSCYSGAGIRGNLVFRSRPGQVEISDSPGPQLVMSPEEEAEQAKWLKFLDWTEAEWLNRRKNVQVKGAALFAAGRDQAAADATFAKNIHAGVFTYALTRYLWQQTSQEGMGKVIQAVSDNTQQFLRTSTKAPVQTPGVEVQTGSQDVQQPVYFSPMQRSAADAIVTEVKGEAVKLLLTGAEPEILEAIGKGAVFTVVDDRGQPQGKVQIESRDRLTATGKLQTLASGAIVAGSSLQEAIRAVPTDLQLRIGLDASLASEMAIAATTLRSLSRIEVIPLVQPMERQEVHYILGRMTPAYHQALLNPKLSGLAKTVRQPPRNDIPEVNSVGLFSIGLEPIPDSFARANESVKDAIQRLRNKLKLLLALRLLKMTLNTTSSQLKVIANLQRVSKQSGEGLGVAAQAFTARSGQATPQGQQGITNAAVRLENQVRVNEYVQIVVKNQEDRDLYMGVLVMSPDGSLDVLFPWTDQAGAAIVKAGEMLQIPTDEAMKKYDASLKFNRPLGWAELLVVASTVPIERALKPLKALANENRSQRRSESQLADKAEVAIGRLLEDLAGGTRSGRLLGGVRRLDVQQMAALSVMFEIVAD